jgi:hypothetical protein
MRRVSLTVSPEVPKKAKVEKDDTLSFHKVTQTLSKLRFLKLVLLGANRLLSRKI